MTTRLLLARHGRTDWTDEHRLQGQTDIPLNETGKHEAQLLRPLVQEWAPERVIASPASRALETARLLTGLGPAQDPRLVEAGLGEWEGLKAEQIGENYAAWRSGAFLPEGAEPRGEVQSRVKAALQEAVGTSGTVLVVTHGGIIRAALELLVGLPTARIVPVAAASLTVLDVVGSDLGTARLRHYNLAPGRGRVSTPSLTA